LSCSKLGGALVTGETKLQDMTVEEKRAEGRTHRGVFYDARTDKFGAEIMIEGDRHWLGRFDTAAEAGAAYAARRAETPVVRLGRPVGGGPTFASAYRDFLKGQPKDSKGFPKIRVGAVFQPPEGNPFTLRAVDYKLRPKKHRDARWVFNRWVSNCSVCGEPYEVTALANRRVLSGLARTCEEHRRKAIFAARATRPAPRAVSGAVAAEVRAEKPRARANPPPPVRTGDIVVGDDPYRPFDPADRLCASMIDDLGEAEARRRWQLRTDRVREGADLL